MSQSVDHLSSRRLWNSALVGAALGSLIWFSGVQLRRAWADDGNYYLDADDLECIYPDDPPGDGDPLPPPVDPD
jgi:hypothetical protein